MNIGLKIIIKGRVQGVGYRWFATQKARVFGLTGTVKNLSNGDVEVFVQGEQASVYEFIHALKEGPTFSKVTETELIDMNLDDQLKEFKVLY